MADDRIDWCDVAAVGLVMVANGGCSIPEAVSVIGAHGLRDHAERHHAFAAALREAHEAGLRERIDVLLTELRALRRELARWEAVARWLGADCDRALGGFCDGFEVIEWLDVREYRTEARAPTIPALAAALGLEVEDE